MSAQSASDQSPDAPSDKPDMTWFTEAKLGIFIHWGIYAVEGIAESWSFFNGELSHDDYLKQLDGFTAANYDPEAWAALFEEAGARYAVLTTKHHDGVALWDTALSELNVVKKSPATRDLVGPYADALKKRGLKTGLYFSHLDWSHPDYPSVFNTDIRDKWESGERWELNRHSWPKDGVEDPQAWERFIAFHRGQLKELSERYQPDLLWFDGDWERDDDQWDMASLRQDLRNWNGPDVILNSRMRGHGDYETPEQALPILQPDGPWEFCMTINHGWGYRIPDNQYKPIPEIIRTFSEVLGMGGNLLLDIGPKADGTIPEKQVATLQALGQWIRKHEEAVYGTRAGLPPGHFDGPTALSQDGQTLFLYHPHTGGGQLWIKGLRSEIKTIRLAGEPEGPPLSFQRSGGAPWQNIPGIVIIDLPPEKADPSVTVIAIELDSPLDVYRGQGGAIEQN